MRSAGPNPTMRRGAKAKANLKQGGSPGRPKLTAAQKAEEKEVRRISRRLLLSTKYQKNLKARLDDGKLQPGVEVMLWYYGFGKPPETIETKQVVPVRVVHEYSE